MTLTPEDVINKRFQPTKFREGYDQDEVDDFLDEIVAELRRLNEENEDLRKQVEIGGGQVAAEPRDDSAASAPVAPEKPVDVSETTEVSETAAPVPAAAPTEPAVAEATQPGTESAESAAGVLAMAQKLHDEYVAQGRSERERLISEGRTQADKLVSDGKRTKEETLSSLEKEKSRLEASVNDLRTFERDYRSNLKDFINGQLRDIDSTGSLAPSNAPAGNASNRTAAK
ncbi:DivIVA domain-containing protein [Kocuria sp. cx-455]|uniref:DivIVA domain-containing protein n=1 Tax=unclassified Candidatus Sulfotelmatobacter TaxID=2635724 RepID=UPI0016832046|nr:MULTISPECIES: DivIVA domain-containing protein [unclassified Candidatus Sulfotelmatobacter]MBD2763369.1 DivIVA domain-containing protein [Kocuria sp. cx-116]MBD2765593.1 DivIVA domain-containing protein [Kocuria sp. cx-455]